MVRSVFAFATILAAFIGTWDASSAQTPCASFVWNEKERNEHQIATTKTYLNYSVIAENNCDRAVRQTILLDCGDEQRRRTINIPPHKRDESVTFQVNTNSPASCKFSGSYELLGPQAPPAPVIAPKRLPNPPAPTPVEGACDACYRPKQVSCKSRWTDPTVLAACLRDAETDCRAACNR
jgi:hypothetical protein